MKRNSVMHDSCLGLALAAVTPLVIGTDLVTAPQAEAAVMIAAQDGGGNPDGWPDPCLDDPESDQCASFMEWLGLQSDAWSILWDAPYDHEKSTMSIEHDDFAWPHGLWDVKVWHDAELDYEDPDLTEEDVLGQIVAEGAFDIALAEEIAWYDDVHVDPDDGVETTVFVTVFIAAGTLFGQTGQEKSALATIMRTEASNSLGDEQMVFNVGLIDMPATLDDAIQAADEIWGATIAEAIGPDKGPGGPVPGDGNDELDTTLPPNRIPGNPICPPSPVDGEPMSAECCECHTNYNNCVAQCELERRIALLDCLADLTMGLLTGGAVSIGCVGVCLSKTAGKVLIACLAGCGVIIAISAAALYICKKKGDAVRDLCLLQNNCDGVLQACLAQHDCN